MKKIIAVLVILSIILSLAACNVNDQDDAEETKEIVLGDEVESVVLTTVEGENITIDTGADFYEIFNKVKIWNKSEKKYSYTAETKLDDNSKSFTTTNIYYPDDFTKGYLIETNVKKEGDDAVAVIEEYSYSKVSADNTREMITFNNYTYKEEKAFGGSVSDANGYKVYVSDEYPIMPEAGSELNDMLLRANHLKMIAVNSQLFQPLEPYEANGKTYDFNDVITREYKLYENYIVFKQTAPFINVNIGAGLDAAIMYALFTNTDCSVTQEAYYNVHTGEIEMIKIYGNTLLYAAGYAGQKMEINMQMYIHDITDAEIQQKVDTLIDYVKTSAE